MTFVLLGFVKMNDLLTLKQTKKNINFPLFAFSLYGGKLCSLFYLLQRQGEALALIKPEEGFMLM